MSKRYYELDALRGAAALMVVMFHFTMGQTEANLGFKLGTTGVDLFFMISGFVIFMSLSKVKYKREFIFNRISRLYPTYWTSVTFTFLIMLIYSILKEEFSTQLLFEYLGNLTMFQYYLGIKDLDGPYWTMILEMTFYIAIFIVFISNSWKFIDIYSVALMLSLLVCELTFSKSIWYISLLKFIPFLQFLPLFYSGIVFYSMVNGQNKLKQYILIALCLLSQVILFNHAGRSSAFISQMEYSVMLIIYFTLFALFANNKLGWIINKPSLFLGKISFALYLTHQYIGSGHLIPFFQNRMQLDFWVSRIITLFVCIGIAHLITKHIEIPYSKRLKQKLYTTWAKKT